MMAEIQRVVDIKIKTIGNVQLDKIYDVINSVEKVIESCDLQSKRLVPDELADFALDIG